MSTRFEHHASRRDDGPALLAVEGLFLCDHVPSWGIVPRVPAWFELDRGPWPGVLHGAAGLEERSCHEEEGVDYRCALPH